MGRVHEFQLTRELSLGEGRRKIRLLDQFQPRMREGVFLNLQRTKALFQVASSAIKNARSPATQYIIDVRGKDPRRLLLGIVDHVKAGIQSGDLEAKARHLEEVHRLQYIALQGSAELNRRIIQAVGRWSQFPHSIGILWAPLQWRMEINFSRIGVRL